MDNKTIIGFHQTDEIYELIEYLNIDSKENIEVLNHIVNSIIERVYVHFVDELREYKTSEACSVPEVNFKSCIICYYDEDKFSNFYLSYNIIVKRINFIAKANVVKDISINSKNKVENITINFTDEFIKNSEKYLEIFKDFIQY